MFSHWRIEAPPRFIVATLAAFILTPAAFAADNAADSGTVAEVIVTGSRIARPELESITPITIVGAPEIQASGYLNVADVLRNLPQVGISAISGSNSNFSTSGGGINSINLRNLGDNRTLVLVNGRRMVSGYTAGALNVVDINMIPTDFIERVDVITGGASAIYGSEAIAGVVNFVLKDHFEGVRIRGQGGAATEGGEDTRLGSLTAGSSFAEDRGSAMINFAYDKDSGLRSAQRAISTTDTSITRPGIIGAFSSFNPQGNFTLADSNGNVDDGLYTFNKSGAVVPYANSLGYNRDAVRRITVPTDRTLISGLLNYKFAEKQQLYTEFTYGQTHTLTEIEPFAIGIGPDPGVVDNVYGGSGIGIPVTNAYIPAGLQAIIAADNADPTVTGGCSTGTTADCITYLGARKRLVDVAIRSSEARRQTARVVGGVKGDIFSTPWTYDVYYNYGRTTDNQQSTGQVNVLNLRYALDSVADPVTGKVVCRDVVAQAQGCVPINIFGLHSITPAAATYINALENREAVIQEQVYSAVAQGPLFKLPAGDIIAVIGAEHRTEQSSEVWDALTNAGLNGGNALPNTFGSYTVKDVFAEAAVPLVSNKPGVKELSIESAVRSSDYNTVGRVTTWNLRLTYAPTSDVRFRGAYSRATRAPNLSELYQGAAQNFPTGVNDPCDGITAASSGAIAAACKAIPAIANAINSPGGFKYGFLDYQSITGFNSGNPHLQPETAKTYTAGLVFTPSALRNFTATVDYYNIKIDNAVGAIDIPTLLNQCLLTGSPTYCTSVFRDPNSGKLTRIDQLSINTATLLTAGVDIGANYRMELPPYLGDSLGFALNWNWLQELNVINQQGAPTIHYKGQIAEAPGGVELPGGPANRATLQAQYNWRGLSVGWTIRYQGPMKDQVDLTQVSPQQLPFNSVPEFTYHDLQLGYSFVESKLKTKLYGGIRNLFDKKPPFLPTGMQTQITGTETAPSSYDAIGRQWFAGIEAEF
ncbi:MAG: TonB-dependent receptor [Gammaproteobacteria bacterium]|nr:TonB-dependent receptor [Gammaproteobacteria bacterium]